MQFSEENLVGEYSAFSREKRLSKRIEWTAMSGKLLVDLPTQYKWLHISFHPFIAIDDSSSRLPRSNVMFPNFFQQRYVQHKNQEMFLSLYLYHYNLDIWMFFLIWRNHFVFLIGNWPSAFVGSSKIWWRKWPWREITDAKCTIFMRLWHTFDNIYYIQKLFVSLNKLLYIVHEDGADFWLEIMT